MTLKLVNIRNAKILELLRNQKLIQYIYESTPKQFSDPSPNPN